MPTHLLPAWSNRPRIVIGMLHLRPLPGAPRFDDDLPRLRDDLLRDADALAEGGVDGLMMENFGDAPFYPDRVPAHVIAHMTALGCAVRDRVPGLPLGINVLRNDGRSALAVAHACGANFIRVNVLCGARVADQGILRGIAHELMRDRAGLGARDAIKVLADVDVKHSAPLGAPRALADEVDDTIARGLADGVIVSGAGTGKGTDPHHVAAVRAAAAGRVAVFAGSGVSPDALGALLPHADGFIVGTSLKRDGRVDNPIDVARVRALVGAVRSPVTG
jgi:membrane complex biogenesis BtpA family protein